MTKTTMMPLALIAATALGGCSFAARSPDVYKSDAEKVIATKQADLKTCYDEALKKDKTAAGKVTVTFSITPETGEFANIAADPKESTAPAALQECVVSALTGLKLDPPDRQEGLVSWSYEFKANPPKQL